MTIGTCAKCYFVRTIPVHTNEGPRDRTVCARSCPVAHEATGSASWPIIEYPDSWGCGDGADCVTMASYGQTNPPADGSYNPQVRGA
jgi:hypothetical protein